MPAWIENGETVQIVKRGRPFARLTAEGLDISTANGPDSTCQTSIQYCRGDSGVAPVDWADVASIAERLSAQYTWTGGYRGFDVLHVATALHLGAVQFLTFDAKQKQFAEAEGFLVPL